MVKKIVVSIILLILIAALLLYFVVGLSSIRGNSMIPTHTPYQNLLVNKLVYKFSEPTRGDVIVFNTPNGMPFISRIIALPGDKIMIRNGEVFINSEKVAEPYLAEQNSTFQMGTGFLIEGEEMQIPENKLFVMGDNRRYAADSREWGFVDISDIIGKVWFCYLGCE